MTKQPTRRPAIHVPRGGLKTDDEEAAWLVATIENRIGEGFEAMGIRANPVMVGLQELLMLSLKAAGDRRVKN